MAYELPTVEDLVQRFPQFATADEYLLSLLIDQAAETVDDSWRAVDYPRAILYLAAHMYTQETGSSANKPNISSESFGPFSVSYAAGGAGMTDISLGATEYGRNYIELRDRNFPGIMVIF